jgi:hypothetical protein
MVPAAVRAPVFCEKLARLKVSDDPPPPPHRGITASLLYRLGRLLPLRLRSRVSDPHFNSDPDLAFYFYADPDPAFHFNANLDLDPESKNNADPCGSGFETLLRFLPL